MLYYTAISTGVFILMSIIAGIFGFGGIALAAAEIARILLFVLLAVFVISLIAGTGKNRRRSWHSHT